MRTKPKPYCGKEIEKVVARLRADGITDIRQILRTVRWRGVWFITCEVAQ
jgi:hypothetical protein